MKFRFLLLVTFVSIPFSIAMALMNYDHFAKFYAQLEKQASPAARSKILEEAIPHAKEKLKSARQLSQALWAESENFDELVKAQIIPQFALETLEIPYRKEGSLEIMSAGIAHTYGYLFSQLQTSFGLKSKRWIEAKLDDRLGLPKGCFSPFQSSGEFLHHVSYALMQMLPTLRESPKWKNTRWKIAPDCRKNLDSSRYVGHIEEIVQESRVKIRTHLIELLPEVPAPTQATNKYLLVYEVQKPTEHPRLVTAFPIDQGFGETFLDAQPKTEFDFKPRFNLFLKPGKASSTGFKKR